MSAHSLPVDPLQRFTGRAEVYRRYRAAYPDAVVEFFIGAASLQPDAVIVDVGAGPGNSALPFLRWGYQVIGLEPNDDMRALSVQVAREYPNFTVLPRTAEATGLPGASADLIMAGSASHWFDAAAARQEFRRVLKPGGTAALMWNRASGESPVVAACSEAVRRARGEAGSGRSHHREAIAEAFFGQDGYRFERIPHRQTLDREGLVGRQLSYSSTPLHGEAHDALVREIGAIFDQHQSGGVVELPWHVDIYWGSLAQV